MAIYYFNREMLFWQLGKFSQLKKNFPKKNFPNPTRICVPARIILAFQVSKIRKKCVSKSQNNPGIGYLTKKSVSIYYMDWCMLNVIC